ncbi:MAG: hypothetical protein ABI882_07570 [Acidobacteriota bacterium]
MKLKSLIFGIAIMAMVSAIGVAQARKTGTQPSGRPSSASFTNAPQARKGVAFVTPQKVAIASLADGYEVRGKATFTVTAANSDDSLAGTLVYAIPDDARQKIAALAGKQVSAVPSSLTVKDVVASFQKGTSCPVVHLEVGPLEIDAVGAKVRFTRKVVLDIPGLEPGTLEKPTPAQEMAMQFCVWTKQINNGGIRRGVIRRINELINGDDQ